MNTTGMHHVYKDLSHVTESEEEATVTELLRQPSVPITARCHPNFDLTFPVKLHYMLSEIEADGLAHIVSWQPHGRCILVHKQEEFVKRILPL